MSDYKYVIVGAGLSGLTIAERIANELDEKVLIIEKRNHIGGNVYDFYQDDILIQKYGPHIYHTNEKKVHDYLSQFTEWSEYVHRVLSFVDGKLVPMPICIDTLNKLYNLDLDEDSMKEWIDEHKEDIDEIKSSEDVVLKNAGRDIYNKLFKNYTEKQWGRDCKELPPFIIKRLPVRFTFDNNYFNALYQGIPIGGYTKLIEKMLDGIEVRLNTDFLINKQEFENIAQTIIYTGPIDAYFDYSLGALEYRSVRFENELLDIENFQGNAAVNYTDRETPYTRIIEHKWFEFGKDENNNDIKKTYISKEYSSEWKPGDEPYYPVNDEKNGALYEEYYKLSKDEKNVIFGGRLGEYKYYDMDQVVAKALETADKCLLS